MTCYDTRDEPMDMMPPKLAIIFQSPPAPHEAMGSTTAGLLCASENHRTGGHRLVSPGPIDAVGGTDDGISPNRKADDDLMGTPPPWGPSRRSGQHKRWPKTHSDSRRANGHDTTVASCHLPVPSGTHNKPWASPRPASCAPQTPTAQSVNVCYPMDPQDAVGGKDDGLGPTPKSDDELMGTPQPRERHLQMTPGPRQGHGQYKCRP
ncbi:Centriolin [Manis pentadactyla]|nr:Centriolin [Manis pentadactyla]